MNKRILIMLLILTVLFSIAFTGCRNTPVQTLEQPVSMYYQRQDMGYGETDGVIAAETVDMGAWNADYLQLMRKYLSGPAGPGLILPVAADVSVLSVTAENGVATVTMSRNFSRLSGCDLTIAATCITKTLTQFEQIHTVRLRAQNAQLAGEEYLEMHRNSVVLEDDGTTNRTQVSIYFADANARYLLELVELVSDVESKELPAYLIQRLIQGPETPDSLPVMPEGTTLLSVSMDNSVCVVDFSREFLTNQPTTWQQERLTVFAIVNTLTSLEEVDRVRIMVEGRSLDQYLYLDLSQDLRADEAIIGPVREGLGEFDAALCVPLEGYEQLFVCPMRMQGRPTEESSQIVLEALLTYQGTNGHYNLIPSGITINAFADTGGICIVDLSGDPLENCQNEAEMILCLQSIVLSLRQTTQINRMQISVNGTPIQDLYNLDTTYLMPQEQYLNQ